MKRLKILILSGFWLFLVLPTLQEWGNKGAPTHTDRQVGIPCSSGLAEASTGQIIRFPCLVKAVIYVESNGRRKARGRNGERGLMQVSYRTWHWACRVLLKERIPWEYGYNEYYNKRVGQAYLKYCLKRCNNNWQDAVRCYNSGYRGAMKLNRGHRYLQKIKRELK